MPFVLLIDDDPHQRALAALVLSSEGHEIREASDGTEGLKLARGKRPDLIVCDVVMPGMNGYQFVTALRAEPSALCTTPVILLTSLSERAQVRVGMNSGADDYLPKPFRPEELTEAVSSLLRRRQAQYEVIAGKVKRDVDTALARQRELLASRYEDRLLQELNSKWNLDMQAGQEAAFPDAVVLAADLFEAVGRAAPAHADPAALLRRAHEAARDALYLFGAAHLLHQGPDLVALFPFAAGEAPTLGNPLRAAFAMQAAMAHVLGGDTPGAQPVAMALDLGGFSMVRLQDPLHGDGGFAAVPGPTLHRVQSLRALAREQGWALAVSPDALAVMPESLAVAGREATVDALRAVELLRPAVAGR
ncbi:response regulator transcription factor [Ramlibacter humi]|uniref:response regulator transcription factor n=1 Tax=Ramlibacter humi TaxID=2530451 RepID=UPI00142FCA37|nr:response regulator [Ramlibacter humi]